jgi:drug/metabolite transporter (DMT)-like permease
VAVALASLAFGASLGPAQLAGASLVLAAALFVRTTPKHKELA